jgi:hypothetical protein
MHCILKSSAEQLGAGAIGATLSVNASGLREPLGRPGLPFFWPHASFARPLFALSALRLLAFYAATYYIRSLAHFFTAAYLPSATCHTLLAYKRTAKSSLVVCRLMLTAFSTLKAKTQDINSTISLSDGGLCRVVVTGG